MAKTERILAKRDKEILRLTEEKSKIAAEKENEITDLINAKNDEI